MSFAAEPRRSGGVDAPALPAQTLQVPRSQAPLLWITGLAGSGKSTLAQALAARLRLAGIEPAVLDGDAVRQALDEPGQRDRHDLQARRQRAWRLAQLAHQTALQAPTVIVATISLLHAVQAWNRRHNAGYAEIVLHAPWSQLRLRRPQLYGDDLRPAAAHVWGLDLAAQYPPSPELELEQTGPACPLDARVDAAIALWQRMKCAQT